MLLVINTEEHKFFWEMREFAKAHAGKLISTEFLVRTNPYKWRCSERLLFDGIFWEQNSRFTSQLRIRRLGVLIPAGAALDLSFYPPIR